jgi:glycosyltransferase involved in cell wall biosynthesis
MSNGQPLISIVLPTFNGARHLSEAIESCLNQTWPNLELIIVDDHSTDSTPEIIARYAARDERIRHLRHDKNRKLPAALNSGFAQARAGYCTWSSDDNLYRPDALDKMAAFLDQNEKVDVIYTSYSRIDEAGRPSSPVLMLAPEYLGYQGNVIAPCFLFRRRVYDWVNGYAEDLFLAEDYFFWLCAAGKFNFASLPEDLYQYREHYDSLTSQKTERVLRVTLTALEKALDRIDLSRRSLRAGIMIHSAALYLHFPEPKRARRLFFAALLAAPVDVLRRTKKGMIVALFLGRSAAACLLAARIKRSTRHSPANT